MKSNKVITLLKEGFRFETLSKLSESQINTLYGKVITEQSITDAAKKAKEELAGKTIKELLRTILKEKIVVIENSDSKRSGNSLVIMQSGVNSV